MSLYLSHLMEDVTNFNWQWAKAACDAIEGSFTKYPIDFCHVNPFMTRPKPNSENRNISIDLSWPKDVSINDSIAKNTPI